MPEDSQLVQYSYKKYIDLGSTIHEGSPATGADGAPAGGFCTEEACWGGSCTEQWKPEGYS